MGMESIAAAGIKMHEQLKAQGIKVPGPIDTAKAAFKEGAKVAEAAAQPIVDSAKAMPKQAKALAKIALDNPALAPLLVPAFPVVVATEGVIAMHKSQVAVAKAVVKGGKEAIHAAQSLSAKDIAKVVANPAYLLLPPGIRETVIKGEIQRLSQAGKASGQVGQAIAKGAARAAARTGGGGAAQAAKGVARASAEQQQAHAAARAVAAGAKAAARAATKTPNND